MEDAPASIVLDTLCFLLACLAVVPIALFFGASLHSLLAYFGYVVGYDVLPGTVLYLLLNGNRPLPRGLPVIGWVLGLSLEVSAYNLADRLGVSPLHAVAYYPALFAVAGFLLLAKRPHSLSPAFPQPYLTAPFLLSLVVPTLLMSIGTFTPRINHHFAEQAAIANAILRGWPYEYPVIRGTPLFYNYLIHTHIAAASAVTAIPTLELASRAVPCFLTVLCLAAIYVFGLNHYRNKWVGVLVIAQTFGVVANHMGSPIQGRILGSALPSAGVYVLSSLAGYSVFLVLVSETFRLFEDETFSARRTAGISLLLWGASGIRAAALVAFGTGVALLIALRWVRSRSCPWRYGLALALAVAAFGGSLVSFYGYGTQYTATSFLQFAGGPASSLRDLDAMNILRQWGLPMATSGLVAYLLIVFGQVTFLLGGALWALTRKKTYRNELESFWLGTLFCGCVFLCFTYSRGGSHFTFMHYGHLGLAMLGAVGLLSLGPPPYLSWRPAGVAGLTIVLACLQLLEVGYVLRGSRNLALQTQPPALMPGDDYQALLAHLRDQGPEQCSYVQVGRWIPNALPAEVPGIRLLGSEDGLQLMLERRSDRELERRLALLEALSAQLEEGQLDASRLRSLKHEFGVSGCLVAALATAEPASEESAGEWEFRAGRFRLLRVD